MFDIIDLYCHTVIKPIESKRNELTKKIYSKKIINLLLRNVYKNNLNKYDKLLYEKYQTLEEIIQKEECYFLIKK